ncbi:sporulation protein YqfD [Neobittarella massiliensis]|uniref:Sporulation protein YqfD n=2 Tax=Oscillospiraceae TaxID=216572 RepID=A0A8J6IL33_9FIRM|nr:sporulation protein YqfD [Neobittarella massiliensis]MBC3515609.1 sporulation protein YqfD [Neobittarella massiliensis]SCJ51645.1 sporulation protein YqfD [uncultured Anaerotruncus sp.]
MYLVSFIRWLLGTVQFRLRGIFSERFINLVNKNGLRLWGLQKEPEGFTANTVARDYKQMHHLARSTGVRLRIQKKKGLPFWARRYRKRIGAVVGLLLCAGFLLHMSHLTWTIQVTGNEKVSTQSILQTLSDLGVNKGKDLRRLNRKATEEKALLALPDLADMTISNKGTQLFIEVREQQKKGEIVDPRQPCDIVAAKKGKILRIQPLEGHPQVEIGQYVGQGDVLISGMFQDYWQRTVYKHAQGEVWAQTEEKVSYLIPLQKTEWVPAGEAKEQRVLDLFGFKLPLYFPKKLEGEFMIQKKKWDLKLLSVEIPIDLITQKITPVKSQVRTLTSEEAKQQADEQVQAFMAQNYKDLAPQCAVTQLEERDGSLFVEYTVTCEENIAKSQEISQ